MIVKGEAWGRPAGGAADVVIDGDDADLAEAAMRSRGRIAFRPAPRSDFARSVGLDPGGTVGATAVSELPCDLLRGHADGGEVVAVNMVVVGTAPDRLTAWTRPVGLRVVIDGRTGFEGKASGVVLGNGEYLRGHDVFPRGHPGDGRLEVQVYALCRRDRRLLRARLATGTHVPHPGIVAASGRRVEVRIVGSRPLGLEVDGQPRSRVRALDIEIVPEAFLLLV